jgi:drug/metabolite transporter (DMT)-like permease
VRATGLVAALALLWGSGFFWIKLSLGGFTPVQLTFARLALGALVLVPIVLIRQLPRPDGAAMWAHLAVSALIANALPYTLWAVAEQTVSSGIAGVINATTPLWTVILAALAGTDSRLSGRTVAGIVLGFLGVIVVYEPWNSTASVTIGIIVCIGAAASYGLAYVYQARFLTNRGFPALTLTAAQLTAAAVIMAIALPFDGGLHITPTALPIVAILILGIVGTGLALIINFALIAIEGPTAASVVTYLLPAVALGLGILLLNEPARITLPFGAALILAGVAVTRRAASKRPVEPT